MHGLLGCRPVLAVVRRFKLWSCHLPLLACLQDYLSRYKELLSVWVVSLVNAALCDYHIRNCPPSPQLTEVCNKVHGRGSLRACRR